MRVNGLYGHVRSNDARSVALFAGFVAAFHLLDPLELNFEFRRPMRFLDMEGGPAIFAEPNEIAERYYQVLKKYLDEMKNQLPYVLSTLP